MSKIQFWSVLVLAMVLSSPAMAIIYDFEASATLTTGPISTTNPQDNWFVNDTGFGNGGVVGAGSNGTRTLSGPSIIGRANNIDFSYSINFASTAWGFSFDFTPSGSTHQAYLAGDFNDDGKIDGGGELTNFVQFSGTTLTLRANNAYVNSSSMIALTQSDWLRSVWIFDWTTNKVSAYMANLTTNIDYTPIAGLQNVDVTSWASLNGLNINNNPVNLGFALYQYSGGEVDNFAFGTSIPEPASLGLVLMGGALLLRRRAAR